MSSPIIVSPGNMLRALN